MFLKKIFMDNTGSLSYLIGCTKTKTACVVDPKRGVYEYINTALTHGLKITHIFDTGSQAQHHNGNMELKLRTGADIYYLNLLDQTPHNAAKEGDEFHFGSAMVKIINSPCHNPFGNSVLVADMSSSTEPWMILNRESLFIGGIDRRSNIAGKDLAENVTRYLDTHEYNYETITNEPAYGKYHGLDRSHVCAMSMA